MTRPRWANSEVDWVQSAALALLLVFALAAGLGLGNDWLWGHNGYNGAAFSQAARNTLRFAEIGQAQYWTAPTPPPSEIIYAHHPLLLHLHVAVMFVLFGEHEWAARLVPAIYSVLSAAMLYFLVRRLWGSRVAVVALFVFVCLPIDLIYANMVDHEQGSIFWSLVMLHHYLRLRETGARRNLWGLLAATFMACQFDWPPYYIAFFLFLHALVGGLRRHPVKLRQTAEFSFLVVFGAFVLVNFFGYFLWIFLKMGSLRNMVDSFVSRSASPDDIWSQTLTRLPDMFPALVLSLAAFWLISFLVRLGRGQSQMRDLLPLSYFLAQTVHQAVFKEAGYLHVYWFYHAAPFVSVASGIALVASARFVTNFRAFDDSASPSGVRRLLVAAALGAILLSLFVAGVRGMAWARPLEGSPYAHKGQQNQDLVYVARWLGEHTARDQAILFHESLPVRIEVVWYFDRVHALVPDLDLDELPAVIGPCEPAYYVLDIAEAPPEAYQGFLREGRPATLMNGHLLAINLSTLSDTEALNESLELVQEEPTLWSTYWKSPWGARAHWVSEPTGIDVLARLRTIDSSPTGPSP